MKYLKKSIMAASFRLADVDTDSESDPDFFEILTRATRLLDVTHDDVRENNDDGNNNNLELFVGHLPIGITPAEVKVYLTDFIQHHLHLEEDGHAFEISELIRPRRGQPFAFVKCTSEAVFEAFLDPDRTENIVS